MSATVRVSGYAGKVTRQMRITAPTVGTVVLPWWPDDISLDGLAGIYETQDRPGRAPLLLRSADPLPELRVGCIVSTKNMGAPGNVSKTLIALRRMAVVKKPVTVKLASRSGRYRFTELGITELEWDRNGQPSSAEVSMTFTRESDAAIPVGPIRKPKR